MSRSRVALALLATVVALAVAAAAYGLMAGPVSPQAPGSSPAYSPYRGVQEVVRAQGLELVTSEGKVWAELAVAQDGSRGLRIYDDTGQKRLELVFSQ